MSRAAPVSDRTISAGAVPRAPAALAVPLAAFVIVALLTVLRLALAAWLPLSFDEAYFWLWSKHLAISYYDHPPGIALAIRLGTLLWGETEFGVRFVPLLASIAASWALWRSARLLLGDAPAAAAACCYFNATLMVAAESMGATPDALVLAAACLLLLAVTRLEATQDGRWWLAAGLAAGFALFAKYTAFFLCGSVALWLVAASDGRKWLRTIWPWAGGLVALAFLVSTLLWNASHDWISFRFQLARTVAGAANGRYMLEFLGSQLALASPFILLLGAAGFARHWRMSSRLAFAAAMIWPALAYFTFHALHSRVQGNWPSFVYPALCVFAASAVAARGPRREALLRGARTLALPVAAIFLAIAYAQAFFGVLPLGRKDPIARMTAVGMTPVAADISHLVRREGAEAIVTTNYVVTGWLSFYLHPHVPIVQITEDYRYLSSPRADPALLRRPLLYVTQRPDREWDRAQAQFSGVRFLAAFTRARGGAALDTFYVYALSGYRGARVGRVP